MRQSRVSRGKDNPAGPTQPTDLVYASIVCSVWPRSEKTTTSPDILVMSCVCSGVLAVSSQGTACHSSIRLFLKNLPENRPTSWPNLPPGLFHCPPHFFVVVLVLGYREHDVRHHNLCCTSCTRRGGLEVAEEKVKVENLGGERRVFCIAKYKWGTTQTTLLLPQCCCCATTLRSWLPPIPTPTPKWSWTRIALFCSSCLPGLLLWQSIVASCSVAVDGGCANEADKRRHRLVYYTEENVYPKMGITLS